MEREIEKNQYIDELGNKIVTLRSDKDKLTQIAIHKLENIARDKGYDSVFSKKAMAFLKGRAFASELDEGILCYSLTEATRKNGMEKIHASASFVSPVKTKGGTIYVAEKEGTYFCWTAHFFDRYIQRTKSTLTRKAAIKEFLKEVLTNGAVFNIDEKVKGVVRIYFKDGVCLGQSYVEKDKRETVILLYKTFVSKDMYNNEQKKALSKNVEALKNNGDLSTGEQKFIEQLIKNDEDEL